MRLKTIDKDAETLFDSFSTKDFEYLLRKLSQASTVNKILGIDHLLPKAKYNLVRDALIRSVHEVHPKHSDLNSNWLDECAEFFSEFHQIFSLNYDLFPYWITASRNFSGFTDYFWSSSLTFDPFNTEVWYAKTRLYYPHGGLFLFEDIDGDIGKIQLKEGTGVLDQIGVHMASLNIPIFISEGTYQAKIKKIQQNQYLTFAYSKLRDMTGGLIIYGASLSSQDSHIAEAIRVSSVYRIAIGIYVGSKNAMQIETEKITIQNRINKPTATFEFFDSSTCPLSYVP